MDDPKSCPYCDLSAEEYCIECDRCKEGIHYACSNLPIYTVIQLHKSTRLFSCSSCVHQRFITTYTGLYDRFNKIIQAQNTTMKRPTGIITEPIPIGQLKRVPTSSANTVGSQTEIDANPDGSSDGDRDVTCRFYLQGKCKHSKMGKDCAVKHPPMCFKFVRRGPRACSKGATCNYIHPKLCNNAII